MDPETFLAHYGVKGMKWGVRRRRSAGGEVSSEAQQAHEVMKKVKKSGTRSLSNKELGDLNKRLQLERQFSQLTYKPGPSKIVSDMIVNTGKQTAQKALSDAAARQVAKAMTGGGSKRGKNKYKNFANDATFNAAK